MLRNLETVEIEIQKQPYPSSLDKHQEFIEIQRSKGLTKQRIYQDLVERQGYTGSYSTVRDFVSKLEKRTPKAYMVMYNASKG